MCSISGIIDFAKSAVNNVPFLYQMNQATAHRGPDAAGIWCAEQAALGHRRLSVVDLAGGSQPMCIAQGGRTAVIVYNGELYNCDEILRKLNDKGIYCDTHSDTEVLLRSYFCWGEACVNHFNGIFAFAIWDASERRLFGARDHFGVKPYFYTIRDDAFIFASEIKSLLEHPAVDAVLDEQGLCEVFGLSPARTPGCGVLKDIYEIKPAHAFTYSKEGFTTWRYWQLQARPHIESTEDTIAHVKQLVSDAIQRQLVSDVPLGCFLSGGLDSSIISSLAATSHKERGLPLKTFSIDYIDNDINFKSSRFQPDNDKPWVERVSDYIGSDHHRFVLGNEELVASLYDATCARDLPGMADVDSSLMLFCRKVKEHVVVALSGECADEIFGGYPWYHDETMWVDGQFPWSRDTDFRTQFLKADLKAKLPITDYVRQRWEETVALAPYLDDDSYQAKKRRQMFALNTNWFMANLLDRKDRMSMSTGLEVRVPYCDYRLAQYVYNIPWDIKALNGREKGVLRAASHGWLPDDVINRKKSPYPKTFHPAYTKAVIKLLLDVINDPQSPILDLVDKAMLQRLCDQDAPIERPWFGQLMSGPQLAAMMVQINQWLKTYHVSIKI